MADISSGHLGRVLDTVISLILSYRQSDQIQTHTFIYSSRVEEQEEQLPRFEIISTSGSLLASFFLASSFEIVSPGKFCVDDVVCYGYVSLYQNTIIKLIFLSDWWPDCILLTF